MTSRRNMIASIAMYTLPVEKYDEIPDAEMKKTDMNLENLTYLGSSIPTAANSAAVPINRITGSKRTKKLYSPMAITKSTGINFEIVFLLTFMVLFSPQ